MLLGDVTLTVTKASDGGSVVTRIIVHDRKREERDARASALSVWEVEATGSGNRPRACCHTDLRATYQRSTRRIPGQEAEGLARNLRLVR